MVWRRMTGWLGRRLRVRRELAAFAGIDDVHALPPIFHYWSHTHVRPLLQQLGADSPAAFFANELRRSAPPDGAAPRWLSLGAGNCDTELEVAQRLRQGGLERFAITCVELNGELLRRGRARAAALGLQEHLRFVAADLNRWRPSSAVDGVMANHSLHHVVDLEHLFDAVRAALPPHGRFVVSDMIGRNGHQRWPEARVEVERFWSELPPDYRRHHQLGRRFDAFVDWDCSGKGFEGIRAQDILPLLLERFAFAAFLGFANVVDVFVDRGFGPNFDVTRAWDREFVDRLHARDEELLRRRRLTPTHAFAVLTRAAAAPPVWVRGLAPADCVRRADAPAPAAAPGRAPVR